LFQLPKALSQPLQDADVAVGGLHDCDRHDHAVRVRVRAGALNFLSFLGEIGLQLLETFLPKRQKRFVEVKVFFYW
jgi:hypothetical protein